MDEGEQIVRRSVEQYLQGLQRHYRTDAPAAAPSEPRPEKKPMMEPLEGDFYVHLTEGEPFNSDDGIHLAAEETERYWETETFALADALRDMAGMESWEYGRLPFRVSIRIEPADS